MKVKTNIKIKSKKVNLIRIINQEKEITKEDIAGKNYLDIYSMLQEARDRSGRLHLCGIGGKSLG